VDAKEKGIVKQLDEKGKGRTVEIVGGSVYLQGGEQFRNADYLAACRQQEDRAARETY